MSDNWKDVCREKSGGMTCEEPCANCIRTAEYVNPYAARIAALEAKIKAADELVEVVIELQGLLSDADEGRIVNYGDSALTAYREAGK